MLAWLAVIVLAYNWARVVLSRSALQLATEEHRRRSAADHQHRSLLDGLPDRFGDDDETGPQKP